MTAPFRSPPVPAILRAPARGRVLVVAPHPDDETMGLGGTLALHAAQGDPVSVLFVCNGIQGDPEGWFPREEVTRIREAEARAAAAVLGIGDLRFLGYPDTSGMAVVDLRVTDALADPPGAADRFATEALVRLPRTAWCFRPDDRSPPVTARDPSAPLVLGVFNNVAKVGPEARRAFAEVLRRLPEMNLEHRRANRHADDQYESHQPPLYYVAAVPFYALARSAGEKAERFAGEACRAQSRWDDGEGLHAPRRTEPESPTDTPRQCRRTYAGWKGEVGFLAVSLTRERKPHRSAYPPVDRLDLYLRAHDGDRPHDPGRRGTRGRRQVEPGRPLLGLRGRGVGRCQPGELGGCDAVPQSYPLGGWCTQNRAGLLCLCRA